MHSFQDLAKQFDQYFTTQVQFPATPSSLYEPCIYALAVGGKRIRPVLTLMGYELFQDVLTDNVFKTAASFELFHNFTLIHDDIMDKSEIRRGREAVYKKYGTVAGILSGDVMNIFAYHILSQVEDPIQLKSLLHLFNQTAIEICEGQQLDMDYESTDVIAVVDYIEMIRLKTSVLLAACLKAGAILGNANEAAQTDIYNFGINLGLAFQIQDDYLDAFGTEDIIGKKPGGDIRCHKKTAMWLKLQEAVKENDDFYVWENALRSSDEEKVATIKALYTKYGIDTYAKGLIQDYSSKAKALLSALPIADNRKQPLQELTAYLIDRKK